MNRVIALYVALAILVTPSCSWWQKHGDPVVQDAISCAKTEALSAGSGFDVIQAADAVITAIAAVATAIGTGDLAAIWSALAPEVAKYGEPFIACVFHDLEGSAAGSGSGSGSAAPLTAEDDPEAEIRAFAHSMVLYRGWRFQ